MWHTVHEFLETRSIRSDRGLARKERRDARHAQRDEYQMHRIWSKIESLMRENLVLKENAEHLFNKYLHNLDKEIDDIESIIADFKTLMRRVLLELRDLQASIITNKTVHQSKELMLHVVKMEEEMKHTYEQYFHGLTSFDSINLSKEKLLGRASQLRDLYNNARALRKPVREVNKNIVLLRKEERAGHDVSPEDNHLKLAITNLHVELRHQSEGISLAILYLQELRADIEEKERYFEELQQKEKYPEDWQKEEFALLEKRKNEIQKWVHNEVEQARLFMSKEEHAQLRWAA